MTDGLQYNLGTAGQAEFAQVSRSPYFEPERAPSSISIAAPLTQSSEQIGSVSATVNAPDLGGSVSYFDNGALLVGCTALPATDASSCDISALPPGTHEIAATYSGDAEFDPSTSSLTVDTSTPATQLPASAPPASSSSVASPSPPRSPSAGAAQAPANGSSGTACTGSGPAPAGAAPGAGSKPLVPGPCSTYLGAFVDPAALGTLNQGGVPSPSVMQIAQSWDKPVTATQLEQVFAAGGIPMVTWNCGDTDRRVASGADDRAIASFAHAVATTGVPILLRWFPDPNLGTAANASCLGQGGATGYVKAYREIVRQFRTAGATNVAFVWSVDTGSGQQGTAPWTDYYPGFDSVDWIAADAYYKASGKPTSADVDAAFGAWYSTFATYLKPLMISDTGVSGGNPQQSQAQYLQALASALPASFPMVKALVYFGAPNQSVGFPMSLNAAGQRVFESLSSNPYFQPSRFGTSTTVTVSNDAPQQGSVVTISANVNVPDLGGNVDFFDNGAPITECSNVAVLHASSCETSSLPAGQSTITAVYRGDAVFDTSQSAPVTVAVGPNTGSTGPPSIPPAGKAYLGAWIGPHQAHDTNETTRVDTELSLVQSLNSGLGRPLSVVHVYQKWAEPTPAAQIKKVLASGAIPMIDWKCGDTDANIVSGKDDGLISSVAGELAALKAPVFLRWYFEPNFPGSAAYASCISAEGPAGYVAAYRHVHDLFEAAGASNVSFVWCMGMSGSDRDWINYYPGSAFVDWIAADGYWRTGKPTPGMFTQRFGPWYGAFAAFGKPMMVTETGAVSGTQASYLSEVRSDLATVFPMIKGLMYFDAAGGGGAHNYVFDNTGLPAFQALSKDLYFQPPLQPTNANISVAAPSARQADPVQAVASVPADNAGSVTFYANGTPIPGCIALPLTDTSTCTTVGLPVGDDAISAVYSGDAQYAGTASGSLGVQMSSMFDATPNAPLLPALPAVGGLVVPPDAPAPLPMSPMVSPGAVFAIAQDNSSMPVDPWGSIFGRRGFGTLAVAIGFVLLIFVGAYIAMTWAKDRRTLRGLSWAYEPARSDVPSEQQRATG